MARLGGTGSTGANAATGRQGKFAEIMKMKMQNNASSELPDTSKAEPSGSEASSIEQADLAVSLDVIHRLPHQVRRYFDSDSIAKLAENIRGRGIRSPLWVRPLPGGKGQYELIAGERRYRAAQILGLEAVPIRVFDVSDDDAFEASLFENLQREDLNPVEETEGILDLLSRRLQLSRNEVISLFNRKAHLDKTAPTNSAVRNSAQTTNSAVRNQWEVIEQIFNEVARITPDAFRVHRLPLLNLPPEILEALQAGRLEYTKAREIAKVKDPDKRQLLLEEAIANSLTLRQVQEQVKLLRPTHTPEPIKQQLEALGKRVTKSTVLEDPDRKARLEELIEEINALLEE